MSEWLDTGLRMIGVGVLVLLNGFFVAAEFALVKVREMRLVQMAEQNIFGARMALHLFRNMNSYLSAAQLGVTMTSLGLGWVAEQALARLFLPIFIGLGFGSVWAHGVSSVLVFLVITFLHIVVGEQAPKVLALQRAEPVVLWVAWPMRIFHGIIFPGIWLLNNASLTVLRWIGMKEMDVHDSAHSADELRMLLKQSSQRRELTQVAGSLLLNALDLRKRKARQIMLHRTKIIFLSTKRTLDENLKIARQSGHTRFPLCEGSIDQVVGMVHLKDLFWLVQDKGGSGHLGSIKRDVLLIPETMPLERLLNLFLTRRIHLAILVDEYGTIVGMVTLENILEEIVGDIQDEFDQETLMFQKISQDEYRLHGELPIHDLEEPFGIHLSEEDVTTVGGYLVKEFGHFPKNGESLILKNYEFTVLKAAHRQISQVGVKRLKEVESSV